MLKAEETITYSAHKYLTIQVFWIFVVHSCVFPKTVAVQILKLTKKLWKEANITPLMRREARTITLTIGLYPYCVVLGKQAYQKGQCLKDCIITIWITIHRRHTSRNLGQVIIQLILIYLCYIFAQLLIIKRASTQRSVIYQRCSTDVGILE